MQLAIIHLYQAIINLVRKMNPAPTKSPAVFKLEGIMNLFMRVLAFVFICFAIRYWLLMVGILEPDIRFDTMPNHWKIAGTFYSVFYPVAALGLWGLFRWGIVIWFITAGFELAMHLIYPQLFGEYNALVIFHFASMGAWLIYALIEYLDKKRTLMKEHQ